MGSGFKNQEGYADPTAGQAIAQIIKEEKKYRPLVYICSPFSSDPVGNTEKAKRYSRYAVDAGAIPFAPIFKRGLKICAPKTCANSI